MNSQQQLEGDSLACEVDEGRRKQLCSQMRGEGHKQYLHLIPALRRWTTSLKVYQLTLMCSALYVLSFKFQPGSAIVSIQVPHFACLAHTLSNQLFYLPKQCVSVPLQSPDDRHSLTTDPTSMKPGSQVKIAVAPNVV